MNRKSVSVILLAAAVMLVIAGSSPMSRRARAQTFFGAQRFPAIDVDSGDNLYLMMSVATAPASEHRPHSQIFFTMSRDYGAAWDNLPATRNLSNSPGEAFGPSLAINKTGKVKIYVAYHDNSTGTTQAYLIRTKKKTKFRKPANITPHSGGAFAPRVALDSNEAVNIVWGDTRDNGGRVIFVRSTDLGATFSGPLDVSRSSGVAFDPEIAVDPGGAINVVWQDTAPGTSVVMFARSIDGGQTFSEPLQVSTGTGAATEAAIAADGEGRLSVVWVDESAGNAEAYYSRSTDSGGTFAEPINVSRFPTGDIHKPSVIAFQNAVYVAFQNGDLFGEESIKNRQVFLAKSDNAGASFGEVARVSNANNSIGRAHSPAMTVDSRGVLHIVWIDASIVGRDEGLLFYSNTANGHQFSNQLMILAVI
ncbi:MAG: sialidase family protein [Acidobacteriota bacterium]